MKIGKNNGTCVSNVPSKYLSSKICQSTTFLMSKMLDDKCIYLYKHMAKGVDFGLPQKVVNATTL